MAEDGSTEMTIAEARAAIPKGINDGIAEIRASLGRIQTNIEDHSVPCWSTIDAVSRILSTYEEMADSMKQMREAHRKIERMRERALTPL